MSDICAELNRAIQWRRPHKRSPATVCLRAVTHASLIVREQRGSYSGRRVSYFRVINPVRAAERAIQVGVFSDLDDYPELAVGSGHVEQGTASNLSSRVRPLERQPTTKGKRE